MSVIRLDANRPYVVTAAGERVYLTEIPEVHTTCVVPLWDLEEGKLIVVPVEQALAAQQALAQHWCARTEVLTTQIADLRALLDAHGIDYKDVIP